MSESNYTVQDYFEVNKIYSELAGETSGKSEKAEAVKIDYLLAYFRGKRSLTSESDFSAELNKSHDEFIGDLLTDPFTLDSMLKRSRLNTRFSLRIGDRADNKKLNLYGNDDETLDEAEKYFICCPNSFERYMAIEQLYLILHPKKDKKKEKYLEFYGETKGKIENLNKAKEKILDKFSPTAVKIYAGIILAAILFIVLTVLGILTPFLTSLGEDAYIQTAVISSVIFSAYVFYKSSSCAVGIVALFVSIIGCIFCQQVPHIFFCILAGLIILFFITCILSEVKRYRYHKSAQSSIDKDELYAIHNKDVRAIKIIHKLLKDHIEFADTAKFAEILFDNFNSSDDEDEKENKPPKVPMENVKKDVSITKARASDIIKYYEKALEEYKSAESKIF